MNTTVIFTNNSLTARHITSITKTTGSELMGASKALLIEEAKIQMRTTSGVVSNLKSSYYTENKKRDKPFLRSVSFCTRSGT